MSGSAGPGFVCRQCGKETLRSEVRSVPEGQQPLPGDGHYHFLCASCGDSGDRLFMGQRSWHTILRVALSLLGGPDEAFSTAEICRFVDEHWERLRGGRERKEHWTHSVRACLSHSSHFSREGKKWRLVPGHRAPSPPVVVSSSSPSSSTASAAKRRRVAAGGGDSSAAAGQSAPSGPQRQGSRWMVPLPNSYSALALRVRRLCMNGPNSSEHMSIGGDGRAVSHGGGYRLARASLGVARGRWYCEGMLRAPTALGEDQRREGAEAHVRVGWATAAAQNDAPVGFDAFGYGVRDKAPGCRVHDSYSRAYGDGFAVGDCLGMWIDLPPLDDDADDAKPADANASANAGAGIQVVDGVRYRPYDPQWKEPLPPLHPGATIRFFLNGRDLGLAFDRVHQGTYYPAVAAAYGGHMEINFGPDWVCPPQGLPEGTQPFSDTLAVHLSELEGLEEEESQKADEGEDESQKADEGEEEMEKKKD